MPEDKFVDGINVTRLENTIETIRKNPEPAQFKFRLHNEWVDGCHAFSVIKDFYGAEREDSTRQYSFIMHADEPDVLLGTNYGPNPTETVMHALACCVGSALIFNAASMGVKIDKMEVDVEGDIDIRGFLGVKDEIRRGLQNIRMNFKISSDAPQSKLQELVDLGQKYSPVFDIVTNPVPVSVMLEGIYELAYQNLPPGKDAWSH